jgi:hypothetical protein
MYCRRRFAACTSAPSELCCKEKVIRHRHTATGVSGPSALCCKEIDYTRRFTTGASPALLRKAGDRAIRGSAKAACGCRAPASSPCGLRWPLRAPPIPCAAQRASPSPVRRNLTQGRQTGNFIPIA